MSHDSRRIACCNILFSAMTIFIGALLVFETVDLYLCASEMGTQAFSAETISERFSAISPTIAAWFFVLFANIVISLIRHSKTEKIKIPSDMTEARLRAQVGNDDALRAQLNRIRVVRIIICIICAVVACGGLVCVVKFSSFTAENFTGDVKHSMLIALPFVVILATIALVYVSVRERTIIKLIECEKQIIRDRAQSGEKFSNNAEAKQHKSFKTVVRIVIIAAALALFIIGCLNKGIAEVFTKATKICTECIGLG